MILFRALKKVQPLRGIFSPLQNVSLYRHCSTKPLLEISDPAVQKYFEYLKSEYWDLKTKVSKDRAEKTKLLELLPVVKVLEERSCVVENLKNLEELNEKDSEDKDMVELLQEERDTYNGLLKTLDQKLLDSLFNENLRYAPSDTILEVTAGVGGQEAMLFAGEIYNMYLGYAKFRKWEYIETGLDVTDIGGVRRASVVFSGVGTFEELRMEGGVHRVQRVPSTEKGGRLHTSTVSVAVLLQPTEVTKL